jgi:hypothetical protein
VLLVDVDGPLNPYAAKPYRRPEGYRTHRLLTPRWEAAERRRLTEQGLPNKPVKPLRVWLDPAHGPALEALPFDLVWATTWEEEANTFIAPVLGLPQLPHIAWATPRGRPEDGVFWKTPEIVAWAEGRPSPGSTTRSPRPTGPGWASVTAAPRSCTGSIRAAVSPATTSPHSRRGRPVRTEVPRAADG